MPEIEVSIWAVMSTPALKEAFRWFNVTVYCPENLMFIDKIDFAWRPVADRVCETAEDEMARTQQLHGVANFIVQTFLLDDSPWEVSLPAVEKSRVRAIVAKTPDDTPLPVSLFDDGYDHVMRDMARSLTTFQQTEVFRSYQSYSTLIESLYSRYCSASGRAEGSEGVSESERVTGELLARIRHLYHTTQALRMVLDPNEATRYQCFVGNELRGFATSTETTFHFHDNHGKGLLLVPRTVLQHVKLRAAKLSGKDDSSADGVSPGHLSGSRSPASRGSPASTPRTPSSRGSPVVSPRPASNEEKRAAFASSRNKSLTSMSKSTLESPNASRKDAQEAPVPTPGKGLSGKRSMPALKGDRRRSASTALDKEEKRTGARRSTSSSPSKNEPATLAFFDALLGQRRDVPLADVKLWWRYHILHPNTAVYIGQTNSQTSLGRLDNSFGFDDEHRIQSQDPTSVMVLERAE